MAIIAKTKPESNAFAVGRPLPYNLERMRKEDEERIRAEVSGRVFESALSEVGVPTNAGIAELINETLHHEGERLRERAADGAVASDRRFYGRVRRRLPRAGEPELKRFLKDSGMTDLKLEVYRTHGLFHSY